MTLRDIIETLRNYEQAWCSEMQCNIMMLPNGYLVMSYDEDKDVTTSTTFVPLNK